MKIIDKHLLRELLIPLAYCFSGFSMILLVTEMFGDIDRIMEVRPGVWVIVRFYISTLGPMLQFLVPASLMLATLYTLYGLTRNSELIAMRACGIGLYRLMMPFVGVGLVISLISGFLNETWVPHAFEWAEEMKSNRFEITDSRTLERCIYLNPIARRQWVIERLDPKNPGIIHQVEVKQEDPDGRRQYVLTADRAEYLDEQWWFFNPRIQRFGDHDNPVGGRVPLGVDEFSVVERRHYTERPEAFVSAVRKWDYLNLREMYHYLRMHPNLSERSQHDKRYSFHNKLAIPWASLIVVFFAIPAGARTGRQGVLSAVFTAIGLMAGFYTLAQLGLVLGSTGVIPPWVGAWLSNLVFGIVGLVLLKRLR